MRNINRYKEIEDRLFASEGIAPVAHRIRLPQLGVSVRVLEVGQGRPALFVPGGPNAASTWAQVAARSQGVRWLLLDRPGTGLSDPPPFVPDARTLPTYMERLVEDVLDALDLADVDLVGSSVGGYCVLRAAAARPDRVRRLVLAGCPAFVRGWTAPSFFSLLRRPWLGRLLLAAPVTAAATRASLKAMGHHQALANRAIAQPMLDWMTSWQRDTHTLRHDAAMIVACGTQRDGFDPTLDLTADTLGAVRAPCLLLVGSDDPVGAEPVARQLAHALPNATLHMLPNAGHLPWLDDPSTMAQHITTFLQA